VLLDLPSCCMRCVAVHQAIAGDCRVLSCFLSSRPSCTAAKDQSQLCSLHFIEFFIDTVCIFCNKYFVKLCYFQTSYKAIVLLS